MLASRLTKLMAFDLQSQSLHPLPTKYVIGLDEVGRGSLIGSVVAAAFCWPANFSTRSLKQDQLELLKHLNDSKQVRADIRAQLSPLLQEIGLSTLGEASLEDIEQLNIHHASLLSSFRAFEKLFALLKNLDPEIQLAECLVLIDGRAYLPQIHREHQLPIIKGDGLSSVIAAASVIAKHTRDSMVQEWAKNYPGYEWETNMGYATSAHRSGIEQLGITPLHRQGYKIVQTQLSLL
jgi:ribonuclease HII